MTTTLSSIARALEGHRPRLATQPGERAAVAAILHAPLEGDSRLLFIQRARRLGDPWSGDLAFPGGRMQAQDAHERATAERETLEEVGLDLSRARLLGRLDDLQATVQAMTVSAFVYAVTGGGPLGLKLRPEEVAGAHWIPLRDLFDPGRRCEHRPKRLAPSRRFAAVDLLGPEHPPLWGVTYRVVCCLAALTGQPLPERVDDGEQR